jgi:hypothetical protein
MRYLKPVVAEVSPNLYTAARTANLNPTQANQVEQMSFAIKKHRELAKMGGDSARKEFDRLNGKAQEQLKFLFKDAEYLQPLPTATDRVQGFFGGALKVAASPLIGLFKLGGQYNRLINTPYKVARQVAQGEDIFAGKTWTDAWNGTDMYDVKALDEAKKYFGEADVFVAQGLLDGKTPGEILESYGKVDEKILASVQKAYDDSTNFKEVMDNVKFSQISPGRDIVRMLGTKPPKSGGPTYDYMNDNDGRISGTIDFIYQIAIDPLTWLTGGLSKGITKGERIKNSVLRAVDSGIPIERAVETAFRTEPKLTKLWQDDLGPAIKKYNEATGAAKAEAFREISTNFPGYANRDAVETLARGKVFDAESAQDYFEKASNLHLMMSGRVDGVTYMRNGVVTAKRHRLLGERFSTYLDGVFNTTSKTTFAGAGRSAEEVDKALEPIVKALVNPEDTLSRLKKPDSADLGVVLKANKEIKRWKRIGQLASRSPAGAEIRTGRDAVLTAANFTARARLLLPRDMAEALTVKFLASSADEQFVILRNLDASTMYAMGLGGDVRGTDLIEEILTSKYGSTSGFATKKESRVNPEHAKFMPEGSVKQNENGLFIDGIGPVHPYQSTFAVGALPYDEIGSMVWTIKGSQNGVSKKNLIYAAGGATQGALSKKIVDAWSILTLFPRLGIRSAIDEATMFLLAAPSRDLRAFAAGAGRKMANVTRTFTGSKDTTGPIRSGLQKTLNKTGKRVNAVKVIGQKTKINSEEAINVEARVNVIERLAKELNVDSALLTNVEKREAVIDEVMSMYSRYIDGDSAEYLRQAFIHQPEALYSAANSIVGRSGLSGRYGEDVARAIITPSQLTLALEAAGVKLNRVSKEIDISTLTEREATLVHFEKFVKQFVGNKFRVGEQVIINPAELFYKYEGFRPGVIDAKTGKEVFEAALDDAMFSLGYKYNGLSNVWEKPVGSIQKIADEFLEGSANTVFLRAQGRTDAEITRIQLSRMFNDMFETFNGGVDEFNENLWSLIKQNIDEMTTDLGRTPTFSQATAKVSMDDFADATEGFRITGTVNSELGVGNYADTENLFRRLGNGAMDMMDRQVNGIFRQPAVMVAYTGLRKKYAGLEREYARQQYETLAGGVFAGTLSDAKKLEYKKAALDIAEKRFTELATREAADTILKFADNPNIRSNFAFASRTVARYYRATEDFYRRIYRLKDVSPRVLYRMRLAHLGLDATGAVHYDQNNEPYVMMPMDEILFRATDTTMRVLTGNSGYAQPQFNEFTLKLRMVNPSFSQDAGLPTLSGPLSGLGVVGFKNILGSVPGSLPFIGSKIDPTMEQVAEKIDTFALGNIGDNMDIRRAIVPSSLQRIWSILPFDEKSRQEVTAAQQAMAYNAAHGRYLDPNATEEEKNEYLNNIRISAHNVIALRNILGLIAPVAPSMQDSKGLPDYIKDVGITSLRGEFFDILNSVSKMNAGDVDDPYELALSTFIGKYPGKLIYTVSPTEKGSKVVIKNTEGLKDWAIKNKGLISTYGESAYIFAPQVGEFNAATYNWLKAAGLVEDKTLEKYYQDLMVAEDKNIYYQIAKEERAALSLESDPDTRRVIIKQSTAARKALKDANPLLNPALIGEGNNIGDEEVMLGKVEQMIGSPNTPIESGTRQRMSVAIKLMRDYIAFARNPEIANIINAVELKAERKRQVEEQLKDLMIGDAYVTEANRAIFRSILNFYSRDSYYAYKELMR